MDANFPVKILIKAYATNASAIPLLILYVKGIVIIATIKPPIKPTQIKEVLDDINVKQAEAISINNEIPTLFTVPFRVICSPETPEKP